MLLSKIATALLQLDTITSLYISKNRLVYHEGEKDTVIEAKHKGGFLVSTGKGPNHCKSEAAVCKVIGVTLSSGKKGTKAEVPATEAKSGEGE